MPPQIPNDVTPIMPSAPQTGPTIHGLEGSAPTSFVGPEKKQELMDMIEKIRGKIGEVNAVKFAGANSLEDKNGQFLREVFDELQKAGVDIADPKAVSKFLDELRATNPDLATLFEEAISALLGETTPGAEAGIEGTATDTGMGGVPEMPGSNETQDEAVPQNV